MSNEKKAESQSHSQQSQSHPMDGVFAALESRVEGLSARVRELAAENARLKGAVVETVAERDRLRKELDDAREVSVRQGGESADKLKRYEAERDEVKTRIARLVKTLEETEAATKTA